jgi:ferric-dicitrate binding protein FerR (iron transport regulator)
MPDDYLWDRSGEPDPEIERMEQVLGRLRSKQPPEWRAPSKLREMPAPGAWAAQVRWQGAIAAGVVLVISAAWLASRPVDTGWKVASIAGAPRVGSRLIQTTGQLAVGDALVTDSASRARLEVGNIGEVELEPNSQLRLLRARRTDHRLALDRGTLHAMIWAPPRLFAVETPAAVAVDLGCAYTLQVDDSGSTTLHVTMGWVGFKQNGHESWVPARAECVMRRGSQPGTPYFVDASEEFRASLARFDFEHDPAALSTVLAAARPADALTLWHLLPKTRGAEQLKVYNRMAALVPPPPGVTRQGILGGNGQMLDLWWDQLGLGDSSWWRIWKGPSPFEVK